MHKLVRVHGLDALRHELQEERKRIGLTMIIPNGTCCQASQSSAVIAAVRHELSRQGLDKAVHLRLSGCLGFCEQEPTIVFEPDNLMYCRVTPADAEEIVAQTVKKGETIERLLYTDPVSGKRARTEA